MPVKIEREPENMGEGGFELCCFCFKSTPYWNVKRDVAVCQDCAPHYNLRDVPTKAEWCAAVERQLNARTRRNH